MSKHTPGPWEYRMGPPRILLGEYMTVYSSPGGTVFHDDGKDRRQVASYTYSEANARLIAAAPDLLQCCIELSAGWDDTKKTLGYMQCETIKKARAAIKAATTE